MPWGINQCNRCSSGTDSFTGRSYRTFSAITGTFFSSRLEKTGKMKVWGIHLTYHIKKGGRKHDSKTIEVDYWFNVDFGFDFYTMDR
jgi:hypothetical protein